mmetsp:Transcript_70416/g.209942  ORF Transcript_70416/g.209942 Transcript_70416/m.209942 type:complete len:205 (+) Transcript_70416:1218-1832(+)
MPTRPSSATACTQSFAVAVAVSQHAPPPWKYSSSLSLSPRITWKMYGVFPSRQRVSPPGKTPVRRSSVMLDIGHSSSSPSMEQVPPVKAPSTFKISGLKLSRTADRGLIFLPSALNSSISAASLASRVAGGSCGPVAKREANPKIRSATEAARTSCRQPRARRLPLPEGPGAGGDLGASSSAASASSSSSAQLIGRAAWALGTG